MLLRIHKVKTVVTSLYRSHSLYCWDGGGRTSLVGQTLTCERESGQIPFIDSCLKCQEFLGMLIDLVMNGACSCLFWLLTEHGASTQVLCFRTRSIYVHIYFIRHPAAEYATGKPYGNLTTLPPSCESLA